jgi:hypothetical protein
MWTFVVGFITGIASLGTGIMVFLLLRNPRLPQAFPDKQTDQYGETISRRSDWKLRVVGELGFYDEPI